jgi:hypothetical protein
VEYADNLSVNIVWIAMDLKGPHIYRYHGASSKSTALLMSGSNCVDTSTCMDQMSGYIHVNPMVSQVIKTVATTPGGPKNSTGGGTAADAASVDSSGALQGGVGLGQVRCWDK